MSADYFVCRARSSVLSMMLLYTVSLHHVLVAAVMLTVQHKLKLCYCHW